MTRLFLLLLTLSITINNSVAQTKSAVAFWKATIEQKSLVDIAAATHDDQFPAWPRIDSASRYRIQNGSLASDERLALAEGLCRKIRSEFDQSISPSLSKVAAYSDLATALQKSDGYSNLLVADTLNRLAIFELSGCLVRNLATPNEVRPLLASVHVPNFDITMLLEHLIPDDEFLSSHKDQLAKIDNSRDAFGAIETLGVPSGKIAYEMMLPTNQSLIRLLKRPSALQLLLRITATETLANVSLPTLLVFVERGGKYEELNPSDIRSFKQRIGEAQPGLRTTFTKVKLVSVGDVLKLYELQNNPEKRRVFLQIALE